ncbi:hypothetical protein RchiOBHm_Chr1g0337561 [Rosa chinensis]|uniref:Uncharacterized protein n=1 Tax=Rosa chinensis TaxID=74649 RepID=A0A2P6SCY6_ROSCH|nr:hypothetical protein RchiOBHm_Chr1g0337561 [Rosa chinensis]
MLYGHRIWPRKDTASLSLPQLVILHHDHMVYYRKHLFIYLTYQIHDDLIELFPLCHKLAIINPHQAYVSFCSCNIFV